MGNVMGGIVNWPFLNEPAWRWFLFVGALLLFLIVWGGVLRHL